MELCNTPPGLLRKSSTNDLSAPLFSLASLFNVVLNNRMLGVWKLEIRT